MGTEELLQKTSGLGISTYFLEYISIYIYTYIYRDRERRKLRTNPPSPYLFKPKMSRIKVPAFILPLGEEVHALIMPQAKVVAPMEAGHQTRCMPRGSTG